MRHICSRVNKLPTAILSCCVRRASFTIYLTVRLCLAPNYPTLPMFGWQPGDVSALILFKNAQLLEVVEGSGRRWQRLRDTHAYSGNVVYIQEATPSLVLTYPALPCFALSNLRCEHSNEKCFPVSSSFRHRTRPAMATTTITTKCRYHSRIIKGRQRRCASEHGRGRQALVSFL